jgi:multiple sugar transport system permease protein
MAPAVAFVLPYYIMYTTLGLFDTYHGMVIVQSIANVPLSIWLLKGFIDAIPKEVEEAAMVDGCSRSGVILRITLPLLTPAIVITGMLVFLFVWNEFFYAMILTRSVAQPFTVVLPVLLGRVKLKWEEMCAAATIVSIIPIILTIVTRKYLIKGLGLGLRI